MVPQLAAWLFLGGSVVGALFTIHAFVPSRSARWLIASFAASMITMELAAHHLAWQMAAAAVFIGLGALGEPIGVLALGVSVVSWVGLVFILSEGRGARRTVEAATESYVSAPKGPRVPLRHLLVPIPFRRAGVAVERNVVYREVAGRRLKLDVYRPESAGEKRPAVIQIHGGGWVVGDKREQGIPLCMHLAANGWVAFNVNYRLSPGATFPDHLVDLKHALVWIREHADEYGIDPSFVAVTGGSAGGHLTALMALTAGDPRYQPGFEDADTSIQAAVPFYGVYDFTNRFGKFPRVFVGRLLQAHVMKARVDEEPEKFAAASPLDCVRADAPPFFVIHGQRDTLAPLKDAQEFVARMREVSDRPVLFAELRGAQHAFDVLTSPRTAPVVEAVERFLDEAVKRHRAER